MGLLRELGGAFAHCLDAAGRDDLAAGPVDLVGVAAVTIEADGHVATTFRDECPDAAATFSLRSSTSSTTVRTPGPTSAP